MPSLPLWLQFALPPVLGAVIGYVTNALAIRMLFRPLERKYIFGIPIPLTPGIIPRQREGLAHSIARMVSKSLFNTQVIQGHIRGEGFQRAIKDQLASLFGPATGEGPVASFDSTQAESLKTEMEARLRLAEDFVLPVIQSSLTRKLLQSLLNNVGQNLGSKQIGQFLPAAFKDEAEIEKFIRRHIGSGAVRRMKWAGIFWVRDLVQSNTSMETIVSPSMLRRGVYLVDRLYIPAVNFLMDFLRRPAIRKEMVRRGKGVLSDIILKLSPVQRFMLSAGQYDKTLEENMPDIVRDLLRTLEKALRDPQNRQHIVEALHEFLRNLQRQGLADLQTSYGIDIGRTLYRVISVFQSASIREGIPRRAAQAMSARLEGEHGLRIDELLVNSAGGNLGQLLLSWFDAAMKWIESDEHRRELREALGEMLLAKPQTPAVNLSEDAPISSPGDCEPASALGLDTHIDHVVQGITGVIESAIPSMVERFDMYQMVVDRVNALEMLEVEQLLLGIIAKHLKYINIFGAILGALIGGAQLLVGRVF